MFVFCFRDTCAGAVRCFTFKCCLWVAVGMVLVFVVCCVVSLLLLFLVCLVVWCSFLYFEFAVYATRFCVGYCLLALYWLFPLCLRFCCYCVYACLLRVVCFVFWVFPVGFI